MLNETTGLDESKLYALVLSVAMHGSARLRARAMKRLVVSLRKEAAARGRCRDRDPRAAERVRVW